jgi:hypothetical protein
MAKNGAETLAKELLDMQCGSVEDAMMLLFDADFTPAVMNKVERYIHELGDASNCECGSEYDQADDPFTKGRAMMKALDDINYFYSREN